MKWLRRMIIAVLCLAAVVLILFFCLPFLNDFKQKGELKIPGFMDKVTIQRDAKGMAYIHARNL